MAHAPLTSVPTTISPHIRRTSSGEVIPVGGYRAGRLKDLGIKDIGVHDRVSKESLQQEHLNIETNIYNSNGEVRDDIPTTQLESHAKRLFSLAAESGVDPVIFSNESFLSNTFDAQNNHSKGIELTGMHPRDALSMLLDRDNLDTIIKSTDALESKFQKDFGIKTERVDPFTFKFQSDWGIGLRNPELRTNITNMLGNRLAKLQSDIPSLFAPTGDPDPASKSCRFGPCIDEISDVQKRGTKAFGKSLAASVILCNVTRMKAPKLPNESISSISKFLSHNNMNTFDYIDANPNDIRKLMTDGLSKEPSFSGKDDVIKAFELLDDNAIIPAFNLMSRKGVNPSFLSSNKEVLDRIQKLGNSIGQMFAATKSPSTRNIYVSRNPMNILTLAPEKSCPSCQTLTRDGKLSISSFNVNIPASYNAQSTNDFIMYSMTGEGQKNARMSLSYSSKEKKYVNHEEFTAYGDDRVGKTILRQFVEDHPDNFGMSEINGMELDSVKKSIDVWKTLNVINNNIDGMDRKFKLLLEDGDVNNVKSVFNTFDEMYSAQNDKKGDAVDGFINEFNDMYYDTIESSKSLLYGSSAHNIVSGSKTIVEAFAKDFKKIDKAFSDIHSGMKRRVSELE